MKRIKQKVLRVISVNLIWTLIVAFTAAPAGAAVKAEYTTLFLYTRIVIILFGVAILLPLRTRKKPS